MCWLLWLQRFVVYTPQGAQFDFDYVPPTAEGVIPQKPANSHVQIEYPMEEPNLPQKPQDPDDPAGPLLPEIPVLGDVVSGYVVELSAIQSDPEAVRKQLEPLPSGTAVLVRVVNFWGYRYYTSAYGTLISEANRKKMDDLLVWLADRDLRVVGRMPAFRDYFYLDEYEDLGLERPSGLIWTSPDRDYWMDPTKEKNLTRLTHIMRELRNLGFDEIVFDDFYFPETEEIAFTGDRKEAIYQAAETLAIAGATEDFTVSFVTSDMNFRLPEGNCRLYVHAEPAEVEDVLAQIQVADKLKQVVFFCNTFDNRFDGYSVIRPYALLT
jgi:hypothetical protein